MKISITLLTVLFTLVFLVPDSVMAQRSLAEPKVPIPKDVVPPDRSPPPPRDPQLEPPSRSLEGVPNLPPEPKSPEPKIPGFNK